MENIFSVQNYKVTLNWDLNVSLVTTCYHENTHELTRGELIEEANGYFKDAGLFVDGDDNDYEIETLQMER